MRYAAAAGQTWLKTGANDVDWTMLDTSLGETSTLLEKWTQKNIMASQVDVDLSALVSTDYDTLKMIRAGSIRGMSTRFDLPITDPTVDSCVVTVTKNGAAGTLSLPHSSLVNPSGGEVTQAAGIDAFVAGDLIGIQITTLASFTPPPPNPTNIEAWLDVSY